MLYLMSVPIKSLNQLATYTNTMIFLFFFIIDHKVYLYIVFLQIIVEFVF